MSTNKPLTALLVLCILILAVALGICAIFFSVSFVVNREIEDGVMAILLFVILDRIKIKYKGETL